MREEIIGDCRLILGDCLDVLPKIGRVDHVIGDPPYESSLHKLKNDLNTRIRSDSGPLSKILDFAPIDAIRGDVVRLVESMCDGWFLAFCTIEGVAKWADEINASKLKYKRACIWVKPDSTPQLNGQCPAQGAECFITAWCGQGHSKWNAGGKRGIYTHLTNSKDRTGEHPTEKPISLMSEILRDFTQINETVCDPFMGSGSTLVACAQMGRKGIGIELNQVYFDLACRRVEQAMKQPRLFSELAQKPRQESML